MFFCTLSALIALTAVAVSSVRAESHTITFVNKCGFGTPTLIQGPNVLSTGAPYTISGPLIDAIAYLQTGSCGFDGENCLTVEITLVNPTFPGLGSGTDLTLIPPHAFSVATGFEYSNGCNGTGADCTSNTCSGAFHSPTDTSVVVVCQTNDVGIVVRFLVPSSFRADGFLDHLLLRSG
ncbi:glycopeptide [Mycena polygramma]|nr:glycopeptide [Mycena polygramma]